MAEKGNPKSQSRKEQPGPRRRDQVAAPLARLAQEATAPAQPARDPGAGHRPPTTAAGPSAPARSRAPAATPPVPSAQGSPGTARGRAGQPGDGAERARSRVRVARLTEAALRQLGGISSYQRILEWLEGTLACRDQAVAELQEELEGYWESLEHEDDEGGL